MLKFDHLIKTKAPNNSIKEAAKEFHKHAHSAMNDFRKEHPVKLKGKMTPTGFEALVVEKPTKKGRFTIY